jgi:hypothetical protein
MDVCCGLSVGMLAPKQEPDEQSQHGDGHPAGLSQNSSYTDGVDTACRIVAVAQQADVIGPRSDDTISGVDNRKSKGNRIDCKTRQCSRNLAVGRDHECSRRVR